MSASKLYLAIATIIIGFGYFFFHQLVQPTQISQITPTTNRLNGTFIRFDPNVFVSTQEIDSFFTELSSLGMDTVIIGEIQTKNTDCNTNTFTWQPGLPAKLQIIFDAAEQTSIKIYVGLINNAAGCGAPYANPNKDIVIQYLTNSTNPDNPIQYILSHYGAHPQFTGWYIPDEPGLGYWATPNITHSYYKGIVDSIRAKSNKPIIVAPSFCGVDGYLSPTELALRTKNFKDNTGIDIFAFQDCVNQHGISLTLNDRFTSGQYYQAISTAIGKDALWADIELGNCCQYPHPPLWNSGAYKPTSIARLVKQIESAPPTVSAKRVTWINQYQLTEIIDGRKPGSDRLLAAYKSLYVDNNEYIFLSPLSYTWITPPSTQYPDTNNQEMFDMRTGEGKNFDGYNNYLDSGYVGFNGSVEVTINFDNPKKLEWVGVHMIHVDAANISFPDSLNLSCSLDNSNWSTLTIFNLSVSQQNSEYVFSNPNNAPLNQDCQYLKLKLVNDPNKWTFVSEIEVIGGIDNSPLPGDFTDTDDTDGDQVNLADYLVFKSGFGTTYTIFDYNSLVANFGQ